jgi:hypothetical protein
MTTTPLRVLPKRNKTNEDMRGEVEEAVDKKSTGF